MRQTAIVLMLCVVCSSCTSVADRTTIESTQLEKLKQAVTTHDKVAIQNANYALAHLYYEEGEFEKAIPYYLQFLELKREEPIDTYHGMAWNLTELASLYFHAGKYDMAMPIYQEAVQKMYDYNRSADVISVLNQMAVCSWKNKDTTIAQLKFSEAQDNYKRAASLPALAKQRSLLDAQYALMLDNWADMSKDIGKKVEFEKLHSTSSEMWQKLRQESNLPASAGKAEIVEALAEYYCRLKKPFQAEVLFDALLELPTADRSRLAGKVRQLRNNCRPSQAERSNEYIQKFNSLSNRQECFDNRQILCQKYAWSVPNEEAVDVLLSHQPLIEVGAGTGYWASLVRAKGGQIVAADVLPAPSKGNHWHGLADTTWTEVLLGDETIVRQYPGSTLFLSWPPETNRCAYNALSMFRGDHLIYVGEDEGACTGTKEFHDLLKRDWHLVKQVEIPQWPGVYDMLYVYARNKPVEKSDNHFFEDKAVVVLGPQLAEVAKKSPVALADLMDLLRLGVKVQFVDGRKRALFNQKTKTIFISRGLSDSQKLQALVHEFSHAVLNPTPDPRPGKTGREEFIRQGFEQEADAVIHELIVADQLQSHGVPVDKKTLTLLSDYKKEGRPAIFKFILAAKNSATNEEYLDHFNNWYDEIVPPSAAVP